MLRDALPVISNRLNAVKSNSRFSGYIVRCTMNNGSTVLYTNPLDCKRLVSITDANNAIALGSTYVEEAIDCAIPTYNSQPYLKRVYKIAPTNQEAATV